MKTVLCFCLVLVTVYAEYCARDNDCHLEVCGTNFRPDCYVRDGSHVCTCVPTSDSSGGSFRCDSGDSCKKQYGDCNKGDHRWHCFRDRCYCSVFG